MILKHAKARYVHMLAESDKPWCWACGRDRAHKPEWWHADFWLERAHIVSRPRKLSRKACVILCSLCHNHYHGASYPQHDWQPLTRANLIWIKRLRDTEYFDPAFLGRYNLGALPEPMPPPPEYFASYDAHRGDEICYLKV